MADPEIVVRLLAAIDEVERPEINTFVERRMDWSYSGDAGEYVLVRCKECGWTATGFEHELIPQADAHVVERHATSPTLRLCQSHRDIVDEWRRAAAEEKRRRDSGSISEAQRHAIGRTQGLFAAVRALARGYGVEDGP